MNSFHTPPLHWTKGPRVRVDSLKPGDAFLAYDGRWYEYVRKDGALSGAHHVRFRFAEGGEVRYDSTVFAGCAEVVVFPKSDPEATGAHSPQAKRARS